MEKGKTYYRDRKINDKERDRKINERKKDIEK